jgi:serine/threonine protein phosphatase 1
MHRRYLDMAGQPQKIDRDLRLYIIGDIHGRSDLLDQLVDEISRDIDQHGDRDSLTITLGDYIDRGPDSRGVLERLSRNPFPTPYVALRGNHEVLLENFLDSPATAEQWRRFGGLETLYSYGVPVNDLLLGKGFEEAARAMEDALPPEHRTFLSSLRNCISMNGCFFCHAGVRPNVPLAQQDVKDLLWIREEFLNSTQDYGKMIIHGHTPNVWPEVKRNRVNIDTGAFATGRLTCLVIEDRVRGRFLFTE